MYVLCSPCILNPDLRAAGITSEADLGIFRAARDRCTRFSLEMVPLPCPETLHLGPDRKPGTFLERLNTPGFISLMDELETGIREMIRERGSPVCVLGVNSSPTCGVTATYYGSSDDSPPKRPGRGVFLSRFPEFPAIDVKTFARYRIYLAAPLFSEAERIYNHQLADLLAQNLFDVYLPQEAGDDSDLRETAEQYNLFCRNLQALRDADIIVAVIDGADADSGTAWEMGYAHALNKPVYALRTDFRRAGIFEHVNLMLEQSATVVASQEALIRALGSPLNLAGDR